MSNRALNYVQSRITNCEFRASVVVNMFPIEIKNSWHKITGERERNHGGLIA